MPKFLALPTKCPSLFAEQLERAALIIVPASFLAVPFDRRLLDQGVHRALALSLFEPRQLTLAQAAKVAGLSLGGFIDLLGSLGVAAVDYPVEELADALAAAR